MTSTVKIVHCKSLANPASNHLIVGQHVQFEICETPKGIEAIHVSIMP